MNKETMKRCCETCKSYRDNSCSGFGPVCSEYERAYAISDDQKKDWPKFGDATAIKLNKGRN